MGQSNVFRASKVMLPLSNAMGYDKMIIIPPPVWALSGRPQNGCTNGVT